MTFGTIVPAFFIREKPISSRRKPACMKKTNTAATRTQVVSTAEAVSLSEGCKAVLSLRGDPDRGSRPTPRIVGTRRQRVIVRPYRICAAALYAGRNRLQIASFPCAIGAAAAASVILPRLGNRTNGGFSMTRSGLTRAAALLLALLVALGAAGCGGGGSSDTLSKSQYEQKIKSVGTDLQNSFKTFDSSNSKDLGSLETKVAAAQTKLEGASNELKGLKPPSDAAADNTKLANAMSGLAREFNSLKQALASGDLSKVQQTANQFRNSPA